MSTSWGNCLALLSERVPVQDFNTWLKPLTLEDAVLIAPNRFIADWVRQYYWGVIQEAAASQGVAISEIRQADVQSTRAVFKRKSRLSRRASRGSGTIGQGSRTEAEPYATSSVQASVDVAAPKVIADVVSTHSAINTSLSEQPEVAVEDPSPVDQLAIDEDAFAPVEIEVEQASTKPAPLVSLGDALSSSSQRQDRSESLSEVVSQRDNSSKVSTPEHASLLNPAFDFDSFVIGKSNQLAFSAARQVAENPGSTGQYNPLFIYGEVGLGKTHLMQAVGNEIVRRNPKARVLYLRSERFVADMVKALQLNAMSEFKRYYRSMDALLIDDIQFFAGKDRTQEEFFHTFNALLDEHQQIIVTSDRYPKEISGLQDRLRSRFEWGLTVAVEPPELETRVAILMKKAAQQQMLLPDDAAFFIAQRVRSHVRELEGALTRVVAHARFVGKPIDIGLVKEALRDLLEIQDKQVSVDNIQRTVAEFYKLKLSELLSKSRTRSIARPRQLAMALSKELTAHSYPEIGDCFGGRDHTTVLHACKRINELKQSDRDLREDYDTLMRSLTS